MFDFIAQLSPLAQSSLVLGVILIVLAALYLVATGKLRIKKDKDGFQLGDNTPFEKTNARFKQLCSDTHESLGTIKEVKGKVDKLELDILKQKVVEESFPISERVKSFEVYKSLGGNG
jgi:hypothetical protein